MDSDRREGRKVEVGEAPQGIDFYRETSAGGGGKGAAPLRANRQV